MLSNSSNGSVRSRTVFPLPQSNLRRIAPLRCARDCSHRQLTTTETFNSGLACLSPFRAKYCWLSVVHPSAVVLRIVTSFLLLSLCVFIRHSSTSAQLKNDLTGSVRGRRKDQHKTSVQTESQELLVWAVCWRLQHPGSLRCLLFSGTERQEYCIQPDMEAGLLCAGKQGDWGWGSQLGQPYLCQQEIVLRFPPARKETPWWMPSLVLSFHLSTQSTLVSGRLCHPSPVRSSLTWLAHVSTHLALRTLHSWSPAVWLTVCLLLKLLTELRWVSVYATPLPSLCSLSATASLLYRILLAQRFFSFFFQPVSLYSEEFSLFTLQVSIGEMTKWAESRVQAWDL